MQRSLRFGRLVIVAGIAVCVGSPPSSLRGQSQKAGGDAGPGGKPSAEGKSLPRVSIQSVQVIKPDPGQADQPVHMRNMRRFGFQAASQEGTTLALLIDEAQQSILSLEKKDCKIKKFCDDRDTGLAQASGRAEGGDLPSNSQLAPENCTVSGEVDPSGHRATLTVHSPHFPADGANRLLLEADVVMRLGHGEKTVEQKNVNLKGDMITVGPSPLIVMTQDPVDGIGQDGGTQVILFHRGPIQRDIKKVAFIGPDGKEFQTQGSGHGQSGSIHQEHYNLTSRVETCTVRLTVHEKIERVMLSFAIETGIGFPRGARRRTLTTLESRGQATD
jgi:hypothetical protein